MSPSQINFDEEKICQNVNLKLEGNATLIGTDFWAEDNYFERKLSMHNLTAEEVGLKVDYPKLVNLYGEEEIEICIQGKKGNHHGVLLYRIEGKPVEVGIWIDANFSKQSFISITGNSVKEEKINPKNIFIITPVIFFIILGILIWKATKVENPGDS